MFFISGAKRKSLRGHSLKKRQEGLKSLFRSLRRWRVILLVVSHVKIGCQSHLPGVDLYAKNTTFELKFYRHYSEKKS